MEHIGMTNGVKHMDVMEAECGMEQLVHVRVDTTLTEVFVSFVLMVKNGMRERGNVFVQVNISGMEIIVKEEYHVQEEEFGMQLFSNVFVHLINSGTELLVWFNLNAAVGRHGIKLLSNVIVQQTLIGMDQAVYFVSTGKFGIRINSSVYVGKEQNGMDISVL